MHLLLEGGELLPVTDDLSRARNGVRGRDPAIVERHIIAALQQAAGDGRADESRPADDEYSHVGRLSVASERRGSGA
jgi:hypothetical protein